MPEINSRQFGRFGSREAAFASFEAARSAAARAESGPSAEPSSRPPAGPSKVRFPSQQQLSLPGLGGDTEQMRLFDTQRAGPANVYTANPSLDAADWRDQDRSVELSEGEQGIIDDEEYTLTGEFFDFEIGPEGRDYLAHQGAHTRAGQEARQQGTFLGEDAYPDKVDPGLQFRDLYRDGDGWNLEEWRAPDETLVGRVEFHEDEWGPNVDHAEINPLYRGRGFSREAISDFAGSLEPGQGIVHAGSYTPAGKGAFHAKGIPTEDDIERGYDDWVAELEEDDLDLEFIGETTMERLEQNHPERPWGDIDQWTDDMHEIEFETRGEIAENMREEIRFDPNFRTNFRENLEEMQSQVLANLPGRRSSFAQGWKPDAKRGVNEELPGMPSKYTGGLA